MPQLSTADGVRLHAVVRPGAGDRWIVLVHGFSLSTAVPALQRVAARLSSYATVLSYDARGHGRSGGVTTLGDREVLDVDAAVRHARRAGARRVATVGFSMGAAAVVRHGAGVAGRVDSYDLAEQPDAVVAVSGTSGWSTRATATVPVRRLHLLVETRTGRAVARAVLRTRIEPRRWAEPPEAPEACAPRLTAPLLVVHGDRDAHFGLEHARALTASAGELWVEPGFGHAEAAIAPGLVDRIGRHVEAVLA